MSFSFSGVNGQYNRYLFEYRHDGCDWGIEIIATSPEEAKERIKSLVRARYQGEVKAKISTPPMGWTKRIASWFR
jgi:hypothetical protein